MGTAASHLHTAVISLLSALRTAFEPLHYQNKKLKDLLGYTWKRKRTSLIFHVLLLSSYKNETSLWAVNQLHTNTTNEV